MNYNVSPEFKTQVSEILATQKFSAVFPFMNLINRDGFIYDEEELNSIVQFLGEFPYSSVAEFFVNLPLLVQPEQTEDKATDPKNEVETESEVSAESDTVN